MGVGKNGQRAHGRSRQIRSALTRCARGNDRLLGQCLHSEGHTASGYLRNPHPAADRTGDRERGCPRIRGRAYQQPDRRSQQFDRNSGDRLGRSARKTPDSPRLPCDLQPRHRSPRSPRCEGNGAQHPPGTLPSQAPENDRVPPRKSKISRTSFSRNTRYRSWHRTRRNIGTGSPVACPIKQSSRIPICGWHASNSSRGSVCLKAKSKVPPRFSTACSHAWTNRPSTRNPPSPVRKSAAWRVCREVRVHLSPTKSSGWEAREAWPADPDRSLLGETGQQVSVPSRNLPERRDSPCWPPSPISILDIWRSPRKNISSGIRNRREKSSRIGTRGFSSHQESPAPTTRKCTGSCVPAFRFWATKKTQGDPVFQCVARGGEDHDFRQLRPRRRRPGP